MKAGIGGSLPLPGSSDRVRTAPWRADQDACGPRLTAFGTGPSAFCDDQIEVVADASLYNISDLAALVGMSPTASPAQLIGGAYRAWGSDCTAFLEGDFAFAVWDRAEARLFCARDHFGVRPLFYKMRHGWFSFATSAGQLLERTGGGSLHDAAVAEFLLGRVLDATSTMFEGVLRLPAAHSLTVSYRGTELRRYWTLEPAAATATRDNAEEFRHLFEKAVARRIDDARSPASLLSGGLDSTSIACIARDRLQSRGGCRLRTYSALFDEPAASNEREYVDCVLDQGGFDPSIATMDGYRPLERFENLLSDMDGPFLAPNLVCMRTIVEQAQLAGTDILLDGHGGDEVVSHGYGRLDELAGSGKWLSLWREAAAAADNYGRPVATLVQQIARRHTGLDAKLVSRGLQRFVPHAATSERSGHLLAADCVARSGLRERVAAASHCAPGAGEQSQHLHTLGDPLQAHAFEILARFYRGCGVEARFPFWDKRLVEFCVSLPAAAKLDGGWSRLILRNAMRGVIPEGVRLRRSKVDFGHHLAHGLVRHHHEQIMDLLEDGGRGLDSYVNIPKALDAYVRMATDPSSMAGAQVQQIWRVVSLAIWLGMRRQASCQLRTLNFAVGGERAA